MGENKFDAIARQRAGQVPGFIGAVESIEDFEARTAAEETATEEPTELASIDPSDAAPYWPSV